MVTFLEDEVGETSVVVDVVEEEEEVEEKARVLVAVRALLTAATLEVLVEDVAKRVSSIIWVGFLVS